MQPYTLQNIDADCTNFIGTIGSFAPHFALFYSTAYVLGCRFEELTQINRFLLLDQDTISFQPAKGNNSRILDASTLDPIFVDMVETQNSYFNRIFYKTSNEYFRRHWPVKQVLLNIPPRYKHINFYIFRYRYVKNLYSIGYSIPQISWLLGEIDNKNTEGYINSQLYIGPF